MWKEIKRINKQDTWPEDGNICKVQQVYRRKQHNNIRIYCVSEGMSMLFHKKIQLRSKTQHKPKEVQRVCG